MSWTEGPREKGADQEEDKNNEETNTSEKGPRYFGWRREGQGSNIQAKWKPRGISRKREGAGTARALSSGETTATAEGVARIGVEEAK